MHAEAYRFVQQVADALGPRQSVLEIGSRNVNGTIRGLFPSGKYVGIDCAPGPDVDIVADGATYTTKQRPDTVICCEVLEHTASAESIIANAFQLLKPGGALVVTCAAPPRVAHSAVDGHALRDGEFYRNVRPDELERWVANHGGHVVSLEYAADRGDVYVWARKG